MKHSNVDPEPVEWRRLLTPAGTIWVLAAAHAQLDLFGRNGFATVFGFITAAVLLVLATAAVGAVALATARAVEQLWLARWTRLGAAMIRRRQRRWDRLAALSISADDEQIQGYLLRRTTISLARPRAATWLADRWASLDARLDGDYGVDLASTWPRLWLTLPESVRAELRTAATAWHRACAWGGWAALYALLGFIWWPALVAAVALAAWAWTRARVTLAFRADLIESAYDLYCPDLALRLGIRPDPQRRVDALRGRELTARARKGA